MKNNIVGWFEIYVSDMDRARKFYNSVLNITLEDFPNPSEDGSQMVAFPWTSDAGASGAPGSLVKMEGMSPGNSGTMVYFNCEDCAEEESRIIASGGKVITSKFSIGDYGFCAWGEDTEGNRFGLHSMK